jgi:hypothetical protein
MSNAFFVNWDDPVVQLELMAEGPSQRFIDYAMNEAMFMVKHPGQRTPHPKMVEIFRFAWRSHSESEENRRYLILSSVITRNSSSFALFYLDLFAVFDHLFYQCETFSDAWKILASEVRRVSVGEDPESAISFREWGSPSWKDQSVYERILSRFYDLARSLHSERTGNFLSDFRGQIESEVIMSRLKKSTTDVIVSKSFDSETFNRILMDRFPEPPNLTTLKFE